MSETFSRQEHTVINVGEEEGEGALRLITCVKASQGFDWNMGMSSSCPFAVEALVGKLDDGLYGFGLMTVCATEMFLPSYVDYHFDDLERRQDPVKDIIVTDEEVRNMFPS